MCLSMAMQATTHENALATPSRFLVDIVRCVLLLGFLFPNRRLYCLHF